MVAASHLSSADLADALVVSHDDLRDYLTGAPMPLDRQLCLALLVLDAVPALARDGHALRAQATAAIAMQQGRTATHRTSPTRLGWY